MKNIGRLIRGERERLGITQAAVSKIVGIDRATISLYENGEREISLSKLNKLATYYGKSMLFFLDGLKEENCNVSYRANTLSQKDEEKIEMAKESVINLYKLKEILGRE